MLILWHSQDPDSLTDHLEYFIGADSTPLRGARHSPWYSLTYQFISFRTDFGHSAETLLKFQTASADVK